MLVQKQQKERSLRPSQCGRPEKEKIQSTDKTACINCGPRKKIREPRDVVCHLCGRKYTVHSINIHIPQYKSLFMARQAKLPESERKPLPKLPNDVDEMDLKARNEAALKLYNDIALEACQFCGRTFLPDRLQVHLRSCAKNHGHEWPPKERVAYMPIAGRGEAANTVYCHVCGRKYTIHSIDIHLPQCEQLWKDRARKLAPEKRKPVPQMPDKNYKKLPLNKRNEMALKVWNDASLEKCQYCGRTFFPDRLEVHLRSCARNHCT